MVHQTYQKTGNNGPNLVVNLDHRVAGTEWQQKNKSRRSEREARDVYVRNRRAKEAGREVA
jgi:hypothetical protein